MRDRFIETVDVLKRILAGRASEEELSRLEGGMQPSDWQEVLDRCRDEDFLSRRWEAYRQYPPEMAYRKFMRTVRLRAFKVYALRIGAAAVLLLSVGLGVWWLGKPQTAVPVVTENAVIRPGTKKAWLTLADGHTIEVKGDSMRVEKIEGMKIAYVDGGIAYQAEKRADKLVFNELTVPVAGECFIEMDDGTRVWVNSASKLKYPMQFVGEERVVFLEGEACFEVKKDRKPFVVRTSMGDIQVTGTVFDVKAYQGDKAVYTTLVSGKVNFRGKETLALEPGEQAVAFTDGKLEKRKVDVAEFIGWKEGMYVFKEQPLENIMTDLARWYGVDVFYQSAGLKEIAFTGNLKRYDHINTFMEVLQRTGEIRYQIKGNTIVLYK